MNRSCLLVPVLLASFLLGARAWAGACGVPEDRLNSLIVRVAANQTLQSFIDALEADHPGLTATLDDTIPGRPIHLLAVDLPPNYGDVELDALEESLLTIYATLIDWGEFRYTDEAPEGGTGSTFVDNAATRLLFDAQYAAGMVGVQTAHGRSTGRGVVVAVLDTGVDLDHPELADRLLPGGLDLVDLDVMPDDIGDGLDNDGDGLVDEMFGHGTFVAGLITLVAPDCRILPIRVLDTEGRGDLWTLAKGMFHAIDQGVEVISISISSTYKSEAVEDAINEAEIVGIAVVAAAGNCNTEDPLEHPASTSSVFGIAATDDLDVKGAFSNFGQRVFISAPGASVLIGDVPDPARSIISTIPGGGFAYWEGTSMATPQVAGAIALIRAQHPEWAASEATLNAIELALTTTAVDIDPLNPIYAGLLGVGRLDAGAAALLGPVAPEPGDLDADGTIDLVDLLLLMADWGLTHSSADLDGDGTVGIQDLLALLAAWAP
ncbi:MAG: S8 family serine peptidase [Planctomycetota bacterium]|jgi:subtilisin family serine protease